MASNIDKKSLSKLLSDAIPMLCKNSLPVSSSFRIEAMIGITLMSNSIVEPSYDSNVVLVCFQQTVTDSGKCIQQTYGDSSRCDKTVSASLNADVNVKQEPATHDSEANETIDIDDDDDEQYDDRRLYEADESVAGAYDQQYEGNSFPTASYSGMCVKSETFTGEMDGYSSNMKSEDLNSEDYYNSQSSTWCDDNQASAQSNERHFMPQPVQKRRSTGLNKMLMQRQRNRLQIASAGRIAKPNRSLGQQPVQTADSGGLNNADLLKGLCRTIANQSIVSQQFICHICHAQLRNKNCLVTHIKGSHLAASLYACDLCGDSFKWYMQLHRHRRRYHSDVYSASNEDCNEFTDQ